MVSQVDAHRHLCLTQQALMSRWEGELDVAVKVRQAMKTMVLWLVLLHCTFATWTLWPHRAI